MAQNDEKEVKYPRIVSTAPCNEDWLAGQSHKRIASKVADIILDESQHGIIGIDGGWGSGKSNLVGMAQEVIKERIKDNKEKIKYEFVTFDAWAHHTDYLRRSLLEEFVNELTIEKNLLSSKWNDSLDMVLARVKEVDMKQTVKLNEFVIGTSILSILTPLIALIFDKPAFYYVMGAVYLLMIAGTVFSIWLSLKKYGQKVDVNNFWTDIRNLYVDAANIQTRQGYSEVNNKNRQTKTREIITEKEPTARQFRNWMSQIDQELKTKKTHVVFVIDNMDRLPIAKVKETWATIHAFFAECRYEYIHAVIPFDRSHIINAFKEENIKEIENKKEKVDDKSEQQIELRSYGNDFINKTFYVVYRVSPPILSDWRDYFERIWKMAFGDVIYKEHDELLLVFEKLSPDFTPRSIIAFINECVTLYSVMEEEIPSEYLGIYILGKERINKEPDKQLLKPDFLQGLKGKYENDEELPQYLSSIHYQIKKDRALDVVYLPKVKKALDDGNTAFIEEIGNDRVLNALLPDAIANTENVDKAIEFMAAVSKREKANEKYRLNYLWQKLFERTKITGYKPVNYDKHHAMLLEHCSDKKSVISFFLGGYLEMKDGWKVTDYIFGIKRFRELAKKDTDEYLALAKNQKTAKEEAIEELLKSEKENYQNYGLKMNIAEFDRHLATKDAAQFATVDYLPLIFSDQCRLDETWKRLIALAAESDDVDEHLTLLKRMKEINYSDRLSSDYTEAYTDEKIYSLYSTLGHDNELTADMVAMRIARVNDFKPSTSGAIATFQEDLANNDELFVKRIADELLYYTSYGKFMVYLEDIEPKQLVVSIAKLLTNKETKLVKKIPNKSQILLYFKEIVSESGVDPKDLLEQVQECEGNIEYDDFTEWPISLFQTTKDMDLDIARSINQHALNHLQEVSTDKWMEQMLNPTFEMNIWPIYKPRLMNQRDAAISVLKKYATEGKGKPDKQLMTNVLNEYGEARYKLKEEFKEIYDKIVNSPNKDNVSYFTSWFFEYDVVDNEASVSALYKTVLLDDQTVIGELVKVGDKLNGIGLPEEFIEKMVQMALGNRKNDEEFVSLCRRNAQMNDAMEKLMKPEQKGNG